MRYKLPKVNPSARFSEGGQNLFDRKSFAEKLTNVVTKSIDDSLVISIEAPWGEGKTQFVYKWINLLKDEHHDLKTIYLDAYAHDFQSDPLTVLISELCKTSDNTDDLKNKIVEVLGAIGKGTLKTGVSIASAGLFTDKHAGQLSDSIGSEITGISSTWVDKIIKNHEEKNSAIQNLKAELSLLASKEGSGHPILFIIDELDRCRPSFALELLEVIKHIFDTKGFVFVLVNNSSQLEESVRTIYGQNIDARSYLIKFFDFSFMLPMENDSVSIESTEFIEQTEQYFFEKTVLDEQDILELDGLRDRLSLSFRDIEKIILQLAIHLPAGLSDSWGNVDFQHDENRLKRRLQIWAAVTSHKFPHLFKKLYTNSCVWEEFSKSFNIDTHSKDIFLSDTERFWRDHFGQNNSEHTVYRSTYDTIVKTFKPFISGQLKINI